MLTKLFSFRFLKRLVLAGIIGLALAAGALWGSDAWVQHTARPHLYSSMSELPANRVGLVLGTSKSTHRGRINLFFKYRMEAAAKLYHNGKVQHLLVSGDNHTKGYDEPTDMRDYLLTLGVPASDITLDYAGFRTLDSVVRAQKVFGQQRFTIISQAFHNKRALFLAHANGLDAVAYNATDVPAKYHQAGPVREVLARTKALLDVYVLGTDPRFLGEPVSI